MENHFKQEEAFNFGHSKECLQYAAKTGQPICIGECSEHQHDLRKMFLRLVDSCKMAAGFLKLPTDHKEQLAKAGWPYEETLYENLLNTLNDASKLLANKQIEGSNNIDENQDSEENCNVKN